jgi:hypothetical protein
MEQNPSYKASNTLKESGNFPPSVNHEGSLYFSQEPTTDLHSEPHESKPHLTSRLLRLILILSSHFDLYLPSRLFSPDFPIKTLYAFLISSPRLWLKMIGNAFIVSLRVHFPRNILIYHSTLYKDCTWYIIFQLIIRRAVKSFTDQHEPKLISFVLYRWSSYSKTWRWSQYIPPKQLEDCVPSPSPVKTLNIISFFLIKM